MIDIEKAKIDVVKDIGRKITEKEAQVIDLFGSLMNDFWSDNTKQNDPNFYSHAPKLIPICKDCSGWDYCNDPKKGQKTFCTDKIYLKMIVDSINKKED